MAFILEPRVRETSITTGTTDFVLAGAMRGSLAFHDVMSIGDTCDYVAAYDDTFEEGTGTLVALISPDVFTLQRTSIQRARHSGGLVDQTKISFVAGVKTIIMTLRSNKAKTQLAATGNAVAPFNPGTLMLFQQTSAPTGWTKQTVHNDKALRVVTGTASFGGIQAFSTVFSRNTSDNTTITQSTSPSHNHAPSDSGHFHSVDYGSVSVATGGGSASALTTPGSGPLAQSTRNGTAVISESTIGSDGTHSHGMDIRTTFVDAIIASKDA